jgi:hypothetical protein
MKAKSKRGRGEAIYRKRQEEVFTAPTYTNNTLPDSAISKLDLTLAF